MQHSFISHNPAVLNAFYAMNFLYVDRGVCSQPFQLLSLGELLGEANIIKQYSF